MIFECWSNKFILRLLRVDEASNSNVKSALSSQLTVSIAIIHHPSFIQIQLNIFDRIVWLTLYLCTVHIIYIRLIDSIDGVGRCILRMIIKVIKTKYIFRFQKKNLKSIWPNKNWTCFGHAMANDTIFAHSLYTTQVREFWRNDISWSNRTSHGSSFSRRNYAQ